MSFYSELKKQQWEAWSMRIIEWFARENIVNTWNEHGVYSMVLSIRGLKPKRRSCQHSKQGLNVRKR